MEDESSSDQQVLEQQKAMIWRIVEEFVCKGDGRVLSELCTPDYKFWPVVYTAPEDLEGHALDNALTLNKIFPDLEAEIIDQVAEGDWVATHHVLRGTHLAEMPTPLGTIAPTGKRVSWRTMAFHKFRDGKIAEGWLSYNPMSILWQVGAVDRWPGDPGLREPALVGPAAAES